MMNHKERTANLRKDIKENDIKAKVAKYNSCGVKWIRVYVPAYESRFTADELEKIALAALDNNLTLVRGIKIDVEHMRKMTGSHQFDFVYTGE